MEMSVFNSEMDTHVEGIVEIEIIVAIEVTAYEVVDLRLGDSVQVLELMHRREFDHVQAIWQDAVCALRSKSDCFQDKGRTRLALEKMLGFIRGDVRHGREHVRTVRRSALNAVPASVSVHAVTTVG